MDNSAFVEAWGSRIIYKGFMRRLANTCIIVIQTSVTVVDPALDHTLAPTTLSHDLGSLDNTVLGNHARMEESLWKSRLPVSKI